MDDELLYDIPVKIFNFFKKNQIYMFCINTTEFGIYDYTRNNFLRYNSYTDFINGLCGFCQYPYNLKALKEFIRKEYSVIIDDKIPQMPTLIKNIFAMIECTEVYKIKKYDVKTDIIASLIQVKDTVKLPVPEVLITDEKGDQFINVYQPSKVFIKAIEFSKGKTITEDEFKNINEFINFFTDFKIEPKNKEYLINYLSWFLQHLGQTPNMSFLLTGEEGTGKQIFTEYILANIFNPETDYYKPKQKELEQFNSKLEGRYLVFIDELTINRQIKDALKRTIANRTITVEGKGIDSKSAINTALFIIAKNNIHNSPIESGSENRRYSILFKNQSLIHEWGESKVNWWCDEFYKDASTGKISDRFYHELSKFAGYLLQQKVDFTKINVPLKNNIRQLMLEIEEEKDVLKIAAKKELFDCIQDAKLFNSIKDRISAKDRKKIRCVYHDEDNKFFFALPALKRDLVKKTKKTSADVLSYLFDKLKFEYHIPTGNHMSTVYRITTSFITLGFEQNESLFTELYDKYYSIDEE